MAKKQSKSSAAASRRPVAARSQSKPKASAAPKKRPRGHSGTSTPTHDEIQVAAYHIYQHREGNGHEGDHQSDWYAAEQQLLR